MGSMLLAASGGFLATLDVRLRAQLTVTGYQPSATTSDERPQSRSSPAEKAGKDEKTKTKIKQNSAFGLEGPAGLRGWRWYNGEAFLMMGPLSPHLRMCWCLSSS